MSDAAERPLQDAWVDIKGYEGLYAVSNCGAVKGIDRMVRSKYGGLKLAPSAILKPFISKGYERVNLSKRGAVKHRFVHRLVAETFIPVPDSSEPLQVNHIDGNKRNNSISNLEWVTARENTLHAFRTGLRVPQAKGKDSHMFGKIGAAAHHSKPVIDKVTGEMYPALAVAADAFGINRSTMRGLISRDAAPVRYV